MKLSRTYFLALVAITVCALPMTMQAGSVITQTYTGAFPATISGTLANQGTALEETVTLPSTSNLSVYTTSYATGGFEPNISLFNSMGAFVAGAVTSGTSPIATADPTTGLALDGYLTADDLAAGTYTIALTDFLLNQSPTATNLSDGFTANYGSGTTFIDEQGNTRTGAYSLDIGVMSTPEPATFWIICPALIALGLIARRRTFATK